MIMAFNSTVFRAEIVLFAFAVNLHNLSDYSSLLLILFLEGKLMTRLS